MKWCRLFALLILVGITAIGASADDDHPRLSLGFEDARLGQPVASGKALGDTIYLLGNPFNPDHVSDGGVGPQANGTFEDQFGNPGWFGWTGVDFTHPLESHWQVNDFEPPSGAYSMWCGTYYDGDPGYGNEWTENLVFTHQVPNTGVATAVHLAATLKVDTEPEYDFVWVEYFTSDGWITWNPGGYDGSRTYSFNSTTTYQPGDYVGINNDEIQLRISFRSDVAWSDEDGLWPTNGACWADDITVTIDDVLVDHEDFEDQVSDRWVPVLIDGVGNFAALYADLIDLDECRSNHSAQVAFIDNGVVVPGTGGSLCTTWCYGPGGYIVNNTGGLMGPDYSLNNGVVSPPLEWPDGADAATVVFDTYVHELLGSPNVWPCILAHVRIRSTDTGIPDDLELAPWANASSYVYGGPEYFRGSVPIGDILVPGRTHLQVSLEVVDLGDAVGFFGTDGTPAPYYDNVAVLAYSYDGPLVRGGGSSGFQDNFPASGDLNFGDLADNSVRLDMARNVAYPADLVNYPGDSILITATAIRAGSALLERPIMRVRMRANPLFDSVRVLPPDFSLTADYFADHHSLVEGWVMGDSTYNDQGVLVEDYFNFDLPDEHFFYPGDFLHYYFEASDVVAGDVAMTLLPADTSGFAAVKPDAIYAEFSVRALPTMISQTPYDQPSILCWCDEPDLEQWFQTLGQLGFQPGVDFDMYWTTNADGGVGNGLGSRATSAQLDGYNTLLYSAGSMSTWLLCNGDFNDEPSNDIQVLSSWFARGGKNAFMAADNMVSAVLDAGAQGQTFANTYFNVSYHSNDIRDLIGNQPTPRVSAIAENGVIARVPEWYVHGGCPDVRTFDAVEAVAGTARLAEFTDPTGDPGIYPYAAALVHHHEVENATVVMMPVDFARLGTVPGWSPPAGYDGIPVRAVILQDILDSFGEFGGSVPVAVAPDSPIAIRQYPNPFNPVTTIELTLARPADISLKIYDLRGRLVRDLVSGRLGTGSHEIRWDGRSDQGGDVASGVYFYEVQGHGEVRIDKLTLVR